MSIYNIHFCEYEELEDLQRFLHNYWRKNHVLSYSKELFEFQYKKENASYYSFVIGRNNLTDEIDGVYGFIESQKYDPSHEIPNMGWGAIWKVRDDVRNKEIGKLGLKMLNFILKHSSIIEFAALGISSIHKDLALSLNCHVGELNHYYIINRDISNFKIAFNPSYSCDINNSKILEIKESSDVSNLKIKNNINIFKNIPYFINRYQKHPFFKYIFWKIYDLDTCIGVFAVRKILIQNSCIFRIIDFIGDIPSHSTILPSIQTILKSENAEYVDCLNYGLDINLFLQWGFCLAPQNNTVVIPEHLDPLEHKYVPLEFECMSDMPLVIFKGDGDQDRPNKV